jgi:hypothetical protein
VRDSGVLPFVVSFLRYGAGSPEGVITAPIGSLYFRTDGGASTTLYVKESGAGNVGWAAIGGAGGSSSSILSWSLSSGAGVPAATTQYTTLTNFWNGTEALRQTVMPACTLTDMVATTSIAQPGTGAFTMEVRKNGANAGKIITVNAGAAAGVFTAAGADVAFADGDLFSVRGTNAAPAAVGASVVGIAIKVTPL